MSPARMWAVVAVGVMFIVLGIGQLVFGMGTDGPWPLGAATGGILVVAVAPVMGRRVGRL